MCWHLGVGWGSSQAPPLKEILPFLWQLPPPPRTWDAPGLVGLSLGRSLLYLQSVPQHPYAVPSKR